MSPVGGGGSANSGGDASSSLAPASANGRLKVCIFKFGICRDPFFFFLCTKLRDSVLAAGVGGVRGSLGVQGGAGMESRGSRLTCHQSLLDS